MVWLVYVLLIQQKKTLIIIFFLGIKSSAVALGWEFSQYKKTNKLHPHKNSSSLCQPVIYSSLTKKSFSTFSRHVRLNINPQPPDLLQANHSDEVKHLWLNTTEKHGLNGEINKVSLSKAFFSPVIE